MLRVKVCGISELNNAVWEYQPEKIVSIIDPDVEKYYPGKFKMIQNAHKRVAQGAARVWRFEDVCDDLLMDSPKLEHTKAILNFVDHSNEKVLIHCHAGISRSSAAAFGVLLLDGWDPKQALECLFASRPDPDDSNFTFMNPNQIMIGHLEKLFNIPGLNELVNEMKFVNLTPYNEFPNAVKVPRKI